MRLPKSLQIKETVSLYAKKYQYKVVLVTPVAYIFRGNDLEFAAKCIESRHFPSWTKIKSEEDIEYSAKVLEVLKSLNNDYTIRVENPRLNFYSNDPLAVETLVNLDESNIKYITIPYKSSPKLNSDSVIVKKLDYDYKITIGRTRRDHSSFLAWADGNEKIKLTKKCERELKRSQSWGGFYFYVRGEKTLTMVRMFLGSDIAKTETVLKG